MLERGSSPPTVPSSLNGEGASSAGGGHGEQAVGYPVHIVPEYPLHDEKLSSQIQAVDNQASDELGSAPPTRTQSVSVTDVQPGDFNAGAQAASGAIGSTGGLGDVLVHVQRHNGTPTYSTHVPPKPGKNFVPGYRAKLVGPDGSSSECVLSGMGKRVVVNQHGQSASFGHSETIHFRSSSSAHLPSNHQMTNRCLVSVQK